MKTSRLQLSAILTVEDIIDIINLKRFDCINYNSCLMKLVKEDLLKPEPDEEEHDTWVCSSSCQKYERDYEKSLHTVYQFSDREIMKVSSEVDYMTLSQRLQFFLSAMNEKQQHERMSGGFNVEESTKTTVLDRRTKRSRVK